MIRATSQEQRNLLARMSSSFEEYLDAARKRYPNLMFEVESQNIKRVYRGDIHGCLIEGFLYEESEKSVRKVVVFMEDEEVFNIIVRARQL